MKKILHIISDLNVGGAERSLVNLCCSINQNKFEFYVVSLKGEGVLAKELQEHSIAGNSLLMDKHFFMGLLRLYRILREFKPDVIVGWMYHGNFVAALARFFCGIDCKIIWNIRHSLDNLEVEKPTTRALIKMSSFLSGIPNNIIYNSLHSSIQHVNIGYSNRFASVISNGYDCIYFQKNIAKRQIFRKKYNIPLEATVIANIGRYHPVKNQMSFLKAASLLNFKNKTSLYFLMVGSGLDGNNSLIADYLNKDEYLRNCTRLVGEQSDMVSLYSAIDINVLCSTSEAFPNVVAEAMAMGIPSVATPVGDCAKIIGDAGIIAKGFDIIDIAIAVQKMLCLDIDSLLELGNNSRKRIIENYSIEKTVKKFEELFYL